MNFWRVEFTYIAERDLANFDPSVRKKINDKIAWFASNYGKLRPEPLHIPFDGFYKLHIGKIRAIYTIENDTHILLMHHIEWRDKVYKH
ncbi:MAG TPA: type II toxin-antitoxin system RelE/ParE family toxin [Candidatus Paceibacterota bacterium]